MLCTAEHAIRLVQILKVFADERMVHRDVSPGNIFLLDNGKVRDSFFFFLVLLLFFFLTPYSSC